MTKLIVGPLLVLLVPQALLLAAMGFYRWFWSVPFGEVAREFHATAGTTLLILSSIAVAVMLAGTDNPGMISEYMRERRDLREKREREESRIRAEIDREVGIPRVR